jgi:hypothetical protein
MDWANPQSYPAVLRAVERQHLGQVVRAWRLAHDPAITQAQLAGALRRSGVVSRQSSVSKFERAGARELDRLNAWADAIDMPVHLRWWNVSAPEGLRPDIGIEPRWGSANPFAAIRTVSEDDMNRREFGTFGVGSLSTVLLHWMAGSESATALTGRAGTTAVTVAEVEHVDRVIAGLRHMDDSLGGGAVLPAAQGVLRNVSTMLNERRFTDQVGRRLLSCSAETLRLAGFLAFDAGNRGQAERYWTAGLQAAQAAGDDRTGANILAFWVFLARYAGDTEKALALAAAAKSRSSDASPRATAIVHISAALAAGMAGDERGVKREIERAIALHGQTADSHGDPDWAYWVDEPHIAEGAGRALTMVGSRDAAGLLDQYTAAQGPGREQAFGFVELGAAYASGACQGGRPDPEQAAAACLRAVDQLPRIQSAQSRSQLHKVRGMLAPHLTLPLVRELDDRARAVAA